MSLKSKSKKIIASLIAVFFSLPLVVQGGEKRVLASVSYTDVCSTMAATGMMTTRAHSTRALDSLSDNILVLVGINGVPQARHSRLVSNSEIFVGLNGTAVSTHTSSIAGYSARQADPFEDRGNSRQLSGSKQKLIQNCYSCVFGN